MANEGRNRNSLDFGKINIFLFKIVQGERWVSTQEIEGKILLTAIGMLCFLFLINASALFKPTCSTEGDDDEEDMDAAVPFGLPWGLEPDENSLRVTKDEKEVSVITC